MGNTGTYSWNGEYKKIQEIRGDTKIQGRYGEIRGRDTEVSGSYREI
jgi:hypothetical protein